MTRRLILALVLWPAIVLGQDTSTPTNTPTETPTFTPTRTPTNTPTQTFTSTPTWTSRPTVTAGATPTLPATGPYDYGCFIGDGTANRVITTTVQPDILFYGNNDRGNPEGSITGEGIHFTTPQMQEAGISCSVSGICTSGTANLTTGDYQFTITGTATVLQETGRQYCWFAIQNTHEVAATGAYAGNGGVSQGVVVGWQPDVVMDKVRRTSTSGRLCDMFALTDRNATGFACGFFSHPYDGCDNGWIDAITATGFTAGTNYNDSGYQYYWIALKKNPLIEKWLWTTTYTANVDSSQVITLSGGRANIIMNYHDTNTWAATNPQASLRTDLMTQNAPTPDDPFIMVPGDDRHECMNLDSAGFKVSDACNLWYPTPTGTPAAPTPVVYYAWGFFASTFTPTSTPTITPTVTHTPTPVATNSCCNMGPDANCVDPEFYGVGWECPPGATPIPQAGCEVVP